MDAFHLLVLPDPDIIQVMAQEALRIDQDRRGALERIARQRGVSTREVLLEAVDEYVERAEDEELLERSAQEARRAGLLEEQAVEIVRRFRRSKARTGKDRP
jgi:hypothetical protein